MKDINDIKRFNLCEVDSVSAWPEEPFQMIEDPNGRFVTFKDCKEIVDGLLEEINYLRNKK